MNNPEKKAHPAAQFFAQVSNDFAKTIPESVRPGFLHQAQQAINDIQALADVAASKTERVIETVDPPAQAPAHGD